jgi:hypothetical protein
MAPFFAPWLPPVKEGWLVFAAGAFLCVPFFLTSVWVEARSAGQRVPAAQALRWAKKANAVTYGFFVVVLVAAALVARMDQVDTVRDAGPRSARSGQDGLHPTASDHVR